MPHTTPAIFLALLLGLVACQSLGSSEAEAEEDVLLSEAVMDLRIGEAEGAAPYRFEHISGITVDQDGRIVVTDRNAHMVRAYDPEGRYLFTIAEEGKEPGEVNFPCCPTFGPDGHLWVRDRLNHRFNQYTLTGAGGIPNGSIRFWGDTWPRLDHAITFDQEGHLIDVAAQRPHAIGAYVARRHRSMDGKSVRVSVHRAGPHGRRETVLVIPADRFSLELFHPMGPTHRHAHSPDGTWAHAFTDTYDLTWRDARGDTLYVLERDLPGPPLTEEERMHVDEVLSKWREDYADEISYFPFEVPERKPVLANIFFDTDGRLWVQRSVKDGAPNEADVYTRDGTLAQVVQWPADVSLGHGHLTADTLYGIRQGDDTFPQVVRLRY